MALAFVVLTCFLLRNSNANSKHDETIQALLERLQKLEDLDQDRLLQIHVLQEKVIRQAETIDRQKENNFKLEERILKLEQLDQQRQIEIQTLQENVSTQEETINKQKDNNLMQEKRIFKLEQANQQRLIDILSIQEKSKSKVMQKESILEMKTAQYLSRWNESDATTTIRKRAEINSGFTTPVAFSAWLPNEIVDVPPGHLIKMTDIKHNEGNGYNVNDGIFVCPKAGLYLFHRNAMPSIGKSMYLNLMVNGVGYANIYAYSQQSYQSSSNLVLVRLNVGDHVFVESAYSTSSFHATYCSFSGVRLSD